MKNEEKHIEEQFSRLYDELVDNVIATPDEDILKEVVEDHGDPVDEANSVRDIIRKSWIKAGKSRLQAARESLDRLEDPSGEHFENVSSPKEELKKFIRDNPEYADELTLAARNGEAGFEDDAAGILEDLRELKKRSTSEKDESK